ncbi:uncharacterized protein K452DRAFT_306235 [Aplosporella prunicola CBS 121167]|uniref:Uncharacterized protein n=1 Tax=Aplosporella prunicola CBS 121167 TaxID=1176127 RepID=A0A6A6BNH4_9PEZI|nr:uncharacterized protein K452DRAFT_306235 [Aplosporella prunicola CBS 121167]KAF2144387.1 hypothetical protein K452DRAFT_306235 [Aplosporella prunicola CBS 121167]
MQIPSLQPTVRPHASSSQMTISPKRKRGPSDPTIVQPFAPRINLSALSAINTSDNTNPQDLSPQAPDSPRSRIATQFESLRLRSGDGAGSALPVMMDFSGGNGSSATASASKKVCRSQAADESLDNGIFAENWNHAAAAAAAAATATRTPWRNTPPDFEIPETPQSSFGSSTTASLPAHASSSFLSTANTTTQSATTASPLTRFTPPPPSSSPSVKLLLSARRHSTPTTPSGTSTTTTTTTANTINTTPTTSTPNSHPYHRPHNHNHRRAHSPPPPRPASPSSPDPTSLTWHDHEITGHLIDPRTDPDDDGTGINGIGFRPSHAVAQARAHKRRQQLLEWRAREAREARARRRERRGAGVTAAVARAGRVGRGAAAVAASAAAAGGAGGEGEGAREGKRVVRFA